MTNGRKSYGFLTLDEHPADANARLATESPTLKRTILAVGGILSAIAISGLAYKGIVEPYHEDRKWHVEAIAITNQIDAYQKDNNYRDAEMLENELWSDIAKKKMDGSWVKASEMDDIAYRLNNNNTRGATRGEPLN